MLSVQLNEPKQFSQMQQPMPKRQQGEVLVKVLACGVCGSDLHAMAGKQPFFNFPRRLGHELCVEVLSADEQSSFNPDERCVVEPYFFCRQCTACRAGKTNCCTRLQVLGIHFDGGHCQFMTLPEQYLHKAAQLSVEQAALVEPLAIGLHAVNRGNIQAGEKVIVIGLGTIGLAAALFAKAAGANLLLVDVSEKRVAFAEQQMRLGQAIVAKDQLAKQVAEIFPQGADKVIDATGNAQSMNAAFELLGFSATLVYVGLHSGDVRLDIGKFIQKDITLAASRAALSSEFKQVIQAITDGQIDPLAMITKKLDFYQIDQSLPKLLEDPELIKALIEY
ncbi:alcohol dehydrogenase catalytic domain-containing protein [Gayadomonas joobiniege]|uniref:alcohol dehydrogenase catalytic domain-containing protein n=1 Tax=Gayadomonas joobiniege TaxID=1234606 RepID=UPI0003695127|nr:alcohol dehydrogenase catalytic domain-containing protein [Gayadomonas joobiniege]